jgi:hypothetical protein
MSARDDFRAPVREVLARRVAFICSFPGCDALTIGPSSDADDGSVSVGVAAHITAAAEGGPRYDVNLSPEERASYANGIWMCQTHARFIDVDLTFTADLLHEWKRAAEERVRARIGVPASGIDRQLTFDLAEITHPEVVNSLIGNALDRCGIARAWGKSEHGCVQDLLIEVARNALQHGGAKLVSLSIEPTRIALYDDGQEFDPMALEIRRSYSGGTLAVQQIRRAHPRDLFLAYSRQADGNELSILRIEALDAGQAMAPCTIRIDLNALHRSYSDWLVPWIESVEGCEDVLVMLPDYMSISDVIHAAVVLKKTLGATRRLHILLNKASDLATQLLAQELPLARFLRLS